MARRSVRAFLKDKLRGSNKLGSLKLGDIAVEDGYAVMTQETLACLVALAEDGKEILSVKED